VRFGRTGGELGETSQKETRGFPGRVQRHRLRGGHRRCPLREEGIAIREGPGRAEEGTMAAKAPTCSTCGAVLSGIGWSPELNFMVSFCPRCKAKEDAPRPAAGKPVVEMGVLDEAA